MMTVLLIAKCSQLIWWVCHYCWKGGGDISDSSLFPVYVGTGAATWVSLLPYYCVCVWGVGVGEGGGHSFLLGDLAFRLGMGTQSFLK